MTVMPTNELIGASLLVYLIPILSIAAIGLLFSTIFRNSAAAVVGTPFTGTFSAAFGGGTNTLKIGAKLTTNAAGTAYVDGNYPGSFDVVFSY